MSETTAADRAVAIETHVNELVTASKEPARNRLQDVSTIVASIVNYAYSHGLPSPLFGQLLDVLITRTTLDQGSATMLIKNLYPVEKVPSKCILRVVSALGVGQSKAPFPSQVLLLRWLYNIYSVMEDPLIMPRLYSALWNLLDIMNLQPALCQLLALITRRWHVKPFRVQYLYTLTAASGSSPELRTLCSVYKKYSPDILINPQVDPRSNVASKSDAAWRLRLAEIWSWNSERSRTQLAIPLRDSQITRTGSKIVPKLQTRSAAALFVAVEDIRSLEALVDSLEKIETPSQIATVLDTPILQQYFQLQKPMPVDRRLDFWLAHCLDDLLSSQGQGTPDSQATETLSLILNYVKAQRTMPPIVDDFFHKYLPVWNGVHNVHIMMELLSYLPGLDFRILHEERLQHVEARVGRNNPNSLEVLSNLYSGLLRRRTIALSISAQASQAVFIRDLQAHVSVLHTSTLVHLSEGNATVSSVVRFYETLSHLSYTVAASTTASAVIVLPRPHAVYLLLFAFQLDTLSRLCTILTAYKSAFEAGIKSSIKWAPDFTSRFNGFLMDVCNIIWRSRALNTDDANSLGCLCPEPTTTALRGYLASVDREYVLASFFGFSHNLTMCAGSLRALQQLEAEQGARRGVTLLSHVGPVTQSSLVALEKEGGAKVSWKEYRVRCLHWLHDHGVSGIRDLMFVTMKDLMKP